MSFSLRLLVILWFCTAAAWAEPLQIELVRVMGPMVGAVTMRSAKLWTQVMPLEPLRFIDVWVSYREVNSNDPLQTSNVKRTDANQHWSVDWQLSNLKPGAKYEYQVHWKSKRIKGSVKPATFLTQAHWQFRTDPPDLKVLAGSCAYTNDAVDDRPGLPYGRSNSIYQIMATRSADVTLWMGDNIYLREPDFGDLEAMSKRYDQWRGLPEIQGLLRQGSHLATWDDHDYGPNDSNGSFVHKDKSLALFKRYWANPSYGVEGMEGVFTQHEASDVAFFILDGRWFRDSDRWIGHDKALYGQAQLRWLKNALLASTATWKLIVSGSQALNLKNTYEGWNKFPEEMNGFMDWLDQQNLNGVMFMSGDRHFSTLLKKDRPSNYPLYELTCSPLTAGAFSNPGAEILNNSSIVEGTVVTTQNFCELDFKGTRKNRQLNVTIRDAAGTALWSSTIHENELKKP